MSTPFFLSRFFPLPRVAALPIRCARSGLAHEARFTAPGRRAGGRVRRRPLTPQSTSEGRNPQWRRRLRAERRRQRRSGKSARCSERGTRLRPLFCVTYRSVVRPKICTVRNHIPRLDPIDDLDPIHHADRTRCSVRRGCGCGEVRDEELTAACILSNRGPCRPCREGTAVRSIRRAACTRAHLRRRRVDRHPAPRSRGTTR